MIAINNVNKPDILGATVSGLCTIHCLLTPLIFVARPLLDDTMGHDHHGHHSGLWAYLDYLFLVLSLIAVYLSARHSSRSSFKWALWLSWAVFAGGLVGESTGINGSSYLMYAGSLSLIIVHLGNLRVKRPA